MWRLPLLEMLLLAAASASYAASAAPPQRSDSSAPQSRCLQHGTPVRLAHRRNRRGQTDNAAPPTGWAAARSHARCSLRGLDAGQNAPSLHEGQRVRVASSVTFQHVPGEKGGTDVKGQVGTVLRLYDEQLNLSASRGVKVKRNDLAALSDNPKTRRWRAKVWPP